MRLAVLEEFSRRTPRGSIAMRSFSFGDNCIHKNLPVAGRAAPRSIARFLPHVDEWAAPTDRASAVSCRNPQAPRPANHGRACRDRLWQLIVRPDIIGAQLHSWSRRGALRRLVAKGKVMIVPYRRRKVFELGERSPVTDAEIVLLEEREQIRARRC